jgi:hypothetical protein
VKVPCHEAGREAARNHREARALDSRRRQEPALDVARELQLAPGKLTLANVVEKKALGERAAPFPRHRGDAEGHVALALQQPLIHQVLERPAEVAWVHVVLPCDPVRLGKRRPLPEIPGQDLAAQLPRNLGCHRFRRVLGQMENHGHRPHCLYTLYTAICFVKSLRRRPSAAWQVNALSSYMSIIYCVAVRPDVFGRSGRSSDTEQVPSAVFTSALQAREAQLC